MASRAHAHDYYGFPPARPRRPVRYPSQDDPVLLPLQRSATEVGVLIASGFAATAIVLAGAYALYAGVPSPPMSETPTLQVTPHYQLDAEPVKAQVFQLLVGPAHAIRNVESTTEPAEQTDTPAADLGTATPFIPEPRMPPLPPPPAARPRNEPPAPQQVPYPDPKPVPYPDPTTTPPDAIAPPNSSPEQPQPLLDPENPYRDPS